MSIKNYQYIGCISAIMSHPKWIKAFSQKIVNPYTFSYSILICVVPIKLFVILIVMVGTPRGQNIINTSHM